MASCGHVGSVRGKKNFVEIFFPWGWGGPFTPKFSRALNSLTLEPTTFIFSDDVGLACPQVQFEGRVAPVNTFPPKGAEPNSGAPIGGAYSGKLCEELFFKI
jgi:hypothetical protein